MKCIFCGKPVFGNVGITVAGEGAAHQDCFQANEALKRVFKNLEITALSDQELTQLKDLVLAEENYRKRNAVGEEGGDDVELF